MANYWGEFPPVSAEDWKSAIEKELKGVPYDSLQWESPEGIIVEPFYTRADSEPINIPVSAAWKIAEYIKVTNPDEANQQAIKALEGGAEVILFDLININPAHTDKNILLRDIIVDIAPVYFLNDPEKQDFFVADMQAAHYSGENMIDELVTGLTRAHNHLINLLEGMHPNEAAGNIYFQLSCGNRYLFEICKVRALKWLWISLAKQYGADLSDVNIIAESSTKYFSKTDPNYNMLRNTAQVMSAVLGGASLIYAHPHNEIPGFGQRIARNVQHLLKDESYMNQVLNGIDGAWFFDSITSQLAEKAWDKFRMLQNS